MEKHCKNPEQVWMKLNTFQSATEWKSLIAICYASSQVSAPVAKKLRSCQPAEIQGHVSPAI